MLFRFQQLLRKYQVPYVRVRQGKGSHDADGVWQPVPPERVTLFGVIQPVKAALLQNEGGRYTDEDRMLFTAHVHEPDDILEYCGKQYKISQPDEREYSDTQQYIMKRVVANAPV